MAQETINIGSYNDDGTGDSLREGGRKINANFTELYNKTNNIINGIIAGDGISVSYAPNTGKVTINNSRVYLPSFGLINVVGQDPVEANSVSSLLRLNPGDNIAITTSPLTDTVTFSAIWPETFSGPTIGIHTGDVVGNLTGNVTGDLYGHVYSLDGSFKVIDNSLTPSNVTLRGNLIGNVNGNLIGNVTGDIVGDVIGDLTGNADTVTNGVYVTDLATVTNAMLAGQITNSKLSNSSININTQDVPLGGSIVIPEYVLPTSSDSILGGVKVGTTLEINVSGVLNTKQDLTVTGSPTFSSLTISTNMLINGTPTLTTHAANKRYVDNAIAEIPPYVLPKADQTQLGGIKVGEGLDIDLATGILSTAQDIRREASPSFENLTIDNHIIINSSPTANLHAVTKFYVDSLYNTFPRYVLPVSTDELLGGIRIGVGLTIDSEAVCSTAQDIRTSASPTFQNVTIPNLPTAPAHAANKAYVDSYSNFPIGGIIMWSGLINAIPDRWALCDGQNGTPDLRNKFIFGASNSSQMNTTGGASSTTTSTSGSHTHNGAVGSTSLTLSQIPSHRHNFNDVWLIADDVYGTTHLDGSTGRPARDANGNPADFFAMVGPSYGQYPLIRAYNDNNLDGGTNDNGIYTIANKTEYVGSGQAHTHSFTIDTTGNHTHSVSTMPPYYALAFIMRMS